MEEIAPGMFHWTAFHDGIRQQVHSYYIPGAAALIDPMEPDEGLDWFAERVPPERILLTNRHHYRHSGRFVDRFGSRVLCHKAGLHEFHGGPAVEGFEFGKEVAPGITAQEVASICPEESAFYIEGGGGALSVADGVVEWPGRTGLTFVPEFFQSAQFLDSRLGEVFICEEAGHGSGGLVFLDLLLDEIAMAPHERPGVREILGS